MSRGWRILVAGLVLAMASAPLEAQTMTIMSSVLQSNFNDATGAGESAPIGAAAFSFSGQPMLADIQSVSITLTVIDGDTGLGANGKIDTPYPPPGTGTYGDDDFDVNSLSLRLNGIDTGSSLLLNGLNSYDPNTPLAASDFVTRTITGAPSNMAALLTALQTGSLTATIYDSTGASRSNGFELPNTQIDRTTSIYATLTLTGDAVPEPAAAVWLSLGGAVCAVSSRRRRSCFVPWPTNGAK